MPSFSHQHYEEMIRAAARHNSMMVEREMIHGLYRKEGFDVDMGGTLRSQPFIDVKCTEAKIDKDFYEHD